jgi:hypothetical protein
VSAYFLLATDHESCMELWLIQSSTLQIHPSNINNHKRFPLSLSLYLSLSLLVCFIMIFEWGVIITLTVHNTKIQWNGAQCVNSTSLCLAVVHYFIVSYCCALIVHCEYFYHFPIWIVTTQLFICFGIRSMNLTHLKLGNIIFILIFHYLYRKNLTFDLLSFL